MDEVGNEGDDDDLDFWGRDSHGLVPGTTRSGKVEVEEDDEDEDDFDDVMEDDVLDGEDEDDDNDHMEIFGHR